MANLSKRGLLLYVRADMGIKLRHAHKIEAERSNEARQRNRHKDQTGVIGLMVWCRVVVVENAKPENRRIPTNCHVRQEQKGDKLSVKTFGRSRKMQLRTHLTKEIVGAAACGLECQSHQGQRGILDKKRAL